MEKTTLPWSVDDLESNFSSINFPEYQREPNIWSLVAKQRLVDSMVRQFDIASLYFYMDEDGAIDCIDGRQRIGAIMSFLNKNPEDPDNGFEFKILNEIYEDENHPFDALDGATFADIEERATADDLAGSLVSAFRNYALTIVQLSGSRRPEEFNLQFTRLNVGTIINSGEKLHAMVGQLRNACFAEGGLGEHAFFEKTRIPTRRFAKEQVAAQVVVQILSLETTGDFTRTRHFDLQRAFKAYATLSEDQRATIGRVKDLLDLLESAFEELGVLRNRAITVSTVLLAWKLGVSNDAEARKVAEFINGFVCRLQWQVKKGLDVDGEYRYFIDFQRHLTQASVEKPAVQARSETLAREYSKWLETGEFTGDEEYQRKSDSDPSQDCLPN
jgi:hypothetical protein